MGTTIIALVSTGRSTTAYKKVLISDTNIFRLPESLRASVDYNPGVLLDDDEWFGLADFRSKSYCLPLLQQETFSSVNYDSLQSSDFGKISFLCGHQDQLFFFQRVTPARQVSKKRIFFGAQCTYDENSATISLNEYADAIFSPGENKLYFRKLRDISAVFDGIDELYREATEEEVKNFLDYNFVDVKEGFASDNVKTQNRKRIAKALEILRTFNDNEKQKVFDYIKDYCPEIAHENNKFSIHNEDSLKKLLYGIEQRYYTTLVGDERRLANSIIPLQ